MGVCVCMGVRVCVWLSVGEGKGERTCVFDQKLRVRMRHSESASVREGKIMYVYLNVIEIVCEFQRE